MTDNAPITTASAVSEDDGVLLELARSLRAPYDAHDDDELEVERLEEGYIASAAATCQSS